MSRIVPHSATYETVERLNKYAKYLLYSTTFLTLTISVADKYELLGIYKYYVIGINIILISLFAFFENRAQYIYTKAEMKRRLDWLDNSFQTNFSGKRSQNYFTNDHLAPGLYKLAVNCFENSSHTTFIIEKMLPRILLKNIIIIAIFIFSAVIGDKEIIRLFFELALPLILIQELIKIIFFSTRMNKVFDGFKSLFNDLMKIEFDNKTAEALKHILEYETTLSWASVPLDSKIFNQYKDHLAKEWDDLKAEYKIKTGE